MKPKNNQPYFVFPPGLSMRSGVNLKGDRKIYSKEN
jgi:hypothetical protein